ncbi:hypothetical protein RI367_007635 [Sorochytrium milnesiophthora]
MLRATTEEPREQQQQQQQQQPAHTRDVSSDISVGDISLSEDDSAGQAADGSRSLASRRKLAGIVKQQYGSGEESSVRALADFLARTGPEDFRGGSRTAASGVSGDDPSALRKLFQNLRKAGSKENLLLKKERKKNKKKDTALSNQLQQQQKFKMLSVRYDDAVLSDNELDSSSSSSAAVGRTAGMQKLQDLMRRSASMDATKMREDLNSLSSSNENDDTQNNINNIVGSHNNSSQQQQQQQQQQHQYLNIRPQHPAGNFANALDPRASWGTLDTIDSVASDADHAPAPNGATPMGIAVGGNTALYDTIAPPRHYSPLVQPSQFGISDLQHPAPRDSSLFMHNSSDVRPGPDEAVAPRSPTNTVMTMVTASADASNGMGMGGGRTVMDLSHQQQQQQQQQQQIQQHSPMMMPPTMRRKIRHVQTQTGSRGTVSHEVQTDAPYLITPSLDGDEDGGQPGDPRMVSLLRNQNTSLQSNVSNLNSELSSTQSENTVLLARIHELESELMQAQMQQSSSQSAQSELLNSYNGLKAEFTSLQQSYDEAYNEVQTRTSELEMYHTQLVANANTIQQLENTLFAERQAHEATREEFDTLSRQAYVKMKQLILERIDLVNEIDVWKMKLREANKLAADRQMEEMFAFGGGGGGNNPTAGGPNSGSSSPSMAGATLPNAGGSASGSASPLSNSPSGMSLLAPGAAGGHPSKLKQSSSAMASLPPHLQMMNGPGTAAGLPALQQGAALGMVPAGGAPVMIPPSPSPLSVNSQQSMNSMGGGGGGGNNSGGTNASGGNGKKVKFQEPLKPALKKTSSTPVMAQFYPPSQQHLISQPPQTASPGMASAALPLSAQQQMQLSSMMGRGGSGNPNLLLLQQQQQQLANPRAMSAAGLLRGGAFGAPGSSSARDHDGSGGDDESDENTDSDDNELMSHDA